VPGDSLPGVQDLVGSALAGKELDDSREAVVAGLMEHMAALGN
jgi:hypothetical protein